VRVEELDPNPSQVMIAKSSREDRGRRDDGYRRDRDDRGPRGDREDRPRGDRDEPRRERREEEVA
jgi:small subunit ribosomal protein S6